jgi:hypothetical protein
MRRITMKNDLNEELTSGRKAAEKVAEHMENMGAAKTEWLIPATHGMWKVSVELVTLDGYTGEESEDHHA